MSLYADLGIESDADPAAIKAAHRRAAKKHHPDRGGKPEDFDRIQRAALVLTDKVKRARYDQTGEDDVGPDNALARIASLIVGAFDQAMATSDFETTDIIALTGAILREQMRALRGKVKDLETARVVVTKVRKRLRFKGTGSNLIDRMLGDRLNATEAAAAQVKAEISHVKTAIEMLEVYGWDFDRPPPAPMYQTMRQLDEEMLRRAMQGADSNPFFR